jgi:hypothetical protein
LRFYTAFVPPLNRTRIRKKKGEPFDGEKEGGKERKKKTGVKGKRQRGRERN